MPPQPGQQHDSRARGRQGDPLHVARRLDALAAGLAGVALSAMEQRLDAVNPVVPLTLIWRSATVPARHAVPGQRVGATRAPISSRHRLTSHHHGDGVSLGGDSGHLACFRPHHIPHRPHLFAVGRADQHLRPGPLHPRRLPAAPPGRQRPGPGHIAALAEPSWNPAHDPAGDSTPLPHAEPSVQATLEILLCRKMWPPRGPPCQP